MPILITQTTSKKSNNSLPFINFPHTQSPTILIQKEPPMKCPACPDQTLSMTERNGIEIDYCPTCRGVWLDRGELDKIIEKSQASKPEVQSSPREKIQEVILRESNYPEYHKHKRKKSFLEELFD